jgi:hypothetical protein
MMPDKPKPRWYHLTPDRFLLCLLLAVGVLFLSEWFCWFPFNEMKGWPVLIAIATVCGAVLFLLLWFAVSLIFRRRFQFSLRSLLVFVLLCAVVSSWFAVRMKQAREQREVLEIIVVRLGGTIVYDHWEMVGPALPRAASSRKLLGADFFSDVFLLYLDGTQVTDAGLEHLKGLTALQGLSLDGTQVTDAGLEHLKGLTALQGLYLDGTQVTDAGLEHLKGLTALQWLYLDGTQVTDAGLEHLKGLTALQELWLGDTQVTDAGLEHLQGLRSLEEVDLSNTKVTDEGVKKLQQTLPNCRIRH